MFDKSVFVLDSGRNYPSVVNQQTTVIEKRAPTDESIKLLKEMQDKAENEILKGISYNNILKDIKMINHKTFENRIGHVIRFVFTINDEIIKDDIFIDDYDKHRYSAQELAKMINQKISEKLTNHFLQRMEQEDIQNIYNFLYS